MNTRSPITPDLKAAAAGVGATLPAELSVTWQEDVKGRPALHLRPTRPVFADKDYWVVVFNGVAFTHGVIEFDALGKTEPPQSNFLGVALFVADESHCDGVYFRPFNFRAGIEFRRIHAVQYVSHPEHPWFELRENKTDQYEKPVTPAPHGDEWFHAKIVVQRPRISVFVNGHSQPSLVVDELSHRTASGVGLYIGPGDGGYFANVKITPA